MLGILRLLRALQYHQEPSLSGCGIFNSVVVLEEPWYNITYIAGVMPYSFW